MRTQGSATPKDKDTPPTPPRGGNNSPAKKRSKTTRFTPPAPADVTAYAASIDFDLDGHAFCDYYQSRGWMVGRSKMKDWKAAVRTWKTRRKQDEEKKREREPYSHLETI